MSFCENVIVTVHERINKICSTRSRRISSIRPLQLDPITRVGRVLQFIIMNNEYAGE